MLKLLLAVPALSALVLRGEAQTIPQAKSSDSAGVRIVETSTIKNAPIAFRIPDAAIIQLGGLQSDPRAEFDARHPFLDAERMADGRIVVADYSALKIFEADGKFVQTIGRAGQGPGEFGQLRGVCVAPGDTIIALNYTTRRVSVFDKNGNHARTFPIKGSVSGAECLGDGSMLLRGPGIPNPSTKMPPERAKVLDLLMPVVRIRSDGSQIDSVGVFPDGFLSLNVASRGNVLARGSSIYAGNGNQAEYRVYTLTGKLTTIVRWRDKLVPVTSEMIGGSNPYGGRLGGLAAGSAPPAGPVPPPRPEPETLPAYLTMLVDGRGRVWLEDYDLPRAARGWTVFDASGQLLGRVALPFGNSTRKDIEIAGFGPDYIVIRWRDDQGATYVSLHRLP